MRRKTLYLRVVDSITYCHGCQGHVCGGVFALCETDTDNIVACRNCSPTRILG